MSILKTIMSLCQTFIGSYLEISRELPHQLTKVWGNFPPEFFKILNLNAVLCKNCHNFLNFSHNLFHGHPFLPQPPKKHFASTCIHSHRHVCVYWLLNNQKIRVRSKNFKLSQFLTTDELISSTAVVQNQIRAWC